MRRCLIVALLALGAGCAAVPTRDTAVVHLKQSMTFPFIGLDFFSVELRAPALKTSGWAAVVTPGKKSIWVQALKGPHGYFGIAPLLGRCSGTVSFDARAGFEYNIEFLRDGDSGALQVIDVATGFVLENVPCVAYK